jgi:hypothetical protein
MVGELFTADHMKEAVQVAADRSAITSVIDSTESYTAAIPSRTRASWLNGC